MTGDGGDGEGGGGLWRVLAMHVGSNADALDALGFFGVAEEDVLSPYVVRRIPCAHARFRREWTGRRWRYAQPTKLHVAPLFPGYLFVRCDDPVACGKVDWAVQGRGALLRPEPQAPPTVISGSWVAALAALCRRESRPDSRDRMLIDAREVAGLVPARGADRVLHRALASGEMVRARLISGPFEGAMVEIEPVVGADALANALSLLDEKGALRIVLAMFGSRRPLVVPREQVDVIGGCMPVSA